MTADEHIMRATPDAQPATLGVAPADPDLLGAVRRRAAFLWGLPPDIIAAAPGRIEIVGNHVDYNGGDVVAATVDRWVVAAVRARDDERLTVTAADIPGGFLDVALDAARAFARQNGDTPAWADYGLAVVATLAARDVPIRGADIYYRGTIPFGVGLSSSSAVLVSLTAALAALGSRTLDLATIATYAQEAEHRVGAPVGLLDQTCAVVGGVLRFAVDPDRVRRLRATLGDAVFAVCDSGVRHGLPGSRYAVRVRECADALARLQAAGYEIATLAELPPAYLDAAVAVLPAPLDARVRHVVTELARVRAAEAALEAGDVAQLGALMTASGESSATLYDISHPAVEAVVARARAVPGVYGARMMGGGDGGSALALLRRDAIEPLRAELGEHAVTIGRIARGLTLLHEALA